MVNIDTQCCNPDFITQVTEIAEQFKSPELSDRVRAAKKMAVLALRCAQQPTDSENWADIISGNINIAPVLISNQTFEEFVKDSPCGIIYTHPDTKTLEINDAYAKMHGYYKAEMQAISLPNAYMSSDLFNFDYCPQTTVEQQTVYEVQHTHKNGQPVYFEVNQRQFTVNGNDIILTYYHDITKRKEAIEISETDELSGVYNRRYFDSKVQELINTRRNQFPVSVIFIDFDNFKQVNDLYGHQTGDLFIQRFGRILKNTFRPEDCVARYGGDEFTVLLSGVEASQLEGLIERLDANLATDNQANPKLQISISVGTATTFESNKLREAINTADSNMQRIKVAKNVNR